jgi:hypothetical protein
MSTRAEMPDNGYPDRPVYPTSSGSLLAISTFRQELMVSNEARQSP